MTVQGFSLLFKISPPLYPVQFAFALGLFGLACLSGNLEAQAVDIPANAQPGAILQHQNQTQQFQTQAPWLNRPITTQDQKGPDIDIKQVETNVNAEIYSEPEPQAPCQQAPASGTVP